MWFYHLITLREIDLDRFRNLVFDALLDKWLVGIVFAFKLESLKIYPFNDSFVTIFAKQDVLFPLLPLAQKYFYVI